MAQGQLLFILSLLIFMVNTCFADEEWARDLQEQTQTMMSKQMFKGLPDPEVTCRVFVSSSMSNELLKAYVKESRRYKAILVFKGLPEGSWFALQMLISDIAHGNEEVTIQIDDEAFDRFRVKTVPSFVLSKNDREFWQPDKMEIFDKVIGNIGIRGALELIAKEGDLAEEANILLEGKK